MPIEGYCLEARPIVFLLRSPVPVQSDTVVTGFALSLAVDAAGFFFAAGHRSIQELVRERPTYHLTLRFLHGLSYAVSVLHSRRANLWVKPTHQHPFRDRFLISLPSCSGFLGRGIALGLIDSDTGVWTEAASSREGPIHFEYNEAATTRQLLQLSVSPRR